MMIKIVGFGKLHGQKASHKRFAIINTKYFVCQFADATYEIGQRVGDFTSNGIDIFFGQYVIDKLP